MAIALGGNQINKAYLGSTDIQKMYLGSDLVFDNSSPPLSLKPIMTNFRVESGQPSRVYFDTPNGEPVGLATTGFTISGNTITGLDTSAKYFSVGTPFTYWDFAILINQEGGNGIVHDFAWNEVVNNIDEPVNSVFKYVAVGASGTGDSIEDPMNRSNAQFVSAGTTVYWKAGDYGNFNQVAENSGTINAPIKHIGYKNTPGDAIQLTRSVGMSFDAAEMPLFSGTGGGWGVTTSGQYNIVRNFQVDNYAHCFNEISQDPDFTVFDNVYGSNSTYGLYVNNLGSTGTKVINSYFADMAEISVRLFNKNNLITNTWAVTSKDTSNDYYLSLYGSTTSEFNIIKGNYVNRFATESHTGHGVSLKAGQPEYQIKNTLVEDNTVLNVGQSLEPRHRGTRYNVFRGNHVEKTNTVTNINGVSFHDGGSFNLFENNLFKNIETCIRWYETTEDDEPGNENAHDVTFKNNIFDGCNSIFDEAIMAGATSPSPIYNNTFDNNTFNDIAYVWAGSDPADFDASNVFTNNIFNSVRNLGSYSNFNASFNYNLFWTSWVNSLGTGSININPDLDANFEPQATFTDIDAPRIEGIYYDRNGLERANPTTVGSVLSADEVSDPVDPPVGGTDLFPQDNAASEADLNSDGVWSGINANVTSISGDAAPDSTYAIQIESSVVSSTGRGEIVWAQEIGDSLTIKLWVKVVQGSFARIDGWVGFAEDVDSGILNDVDNGDWTEYTYNVTADAVEGKMRIYSAYNTSGTVGDIILVDRVTVIKP